jgi:hypothetical protein
MTYSFCLGLVLAYRTPQNCIDWSLRHRFSRYVDRVGPRVLSRPIYRFWTCLSGVPGTFKFEEARGDVSSYVFLGFCGGVHIMNIRDFDS